VRIVLTMKILYVNDRNQGEDISRILLNVCLYYPEIQGDVLLSQVLRSPVIYIIVYNLRIGHIHSE